MKTLTVLELSKLYNINRQTIYNNIKKGILSKNSDNKIDVAEAILSEEVAVLFTIFSYLSITLTDFRDPQYRRGVCPSAGTPPTSASAPSSSRICP